MQRIINDPNMVVEDMLKGFAKCHRDIIHVEEENPRVIISNSFNKQKKVGIVTGGGSGHKPAFIGYCGEHMVDAVAVGEIFSSPTAKSFYGAIRAVDQGMGVAVLYGNYAGDNMNVKMAMELAEDDDIEVRTVVANDDVASAPKEDIAKRRGVAGEIFLWKIGGAKAAQGADLDAVIHAAQRRSTIQEVSASVWGRVRSPQTESRISKSSRGRWSSVSDIMASRGTCGAPGNGRADGAGDGGHGHPRCTVCERG